jgi:hypothetical protein
MLFLAAAALVAAAPQPAPQAPVTASVQAQATIRIISGVEVRFGGASSAGAPAPRDSTIQLNGSAQPARLVEFE